MFILIIEIFSLIFELVVFVNINCRLRGVMMICHDNFRQKEVTMAYLAAASRILYSAT